MIDLHITPEVGRSPARRGDRLCRSGFSGPKSVHAGVAIVEMSEQEALPDRLEFVDGK
jgi:hypothetical protein